MRDCLKFFMYVFMIKGEKKWFCFICCYEFYNIKIYVFNCKGRVYSIVDKWNCEI